MAELICDFEGFESEPYEDLSKGGLVIGCGMRAGRRKHITKDESVRILSFAVGNLRHEAESKYPDLNSEQIAGIVSILWNTPKRRDIITNNVITTAVKNGDKKTVEHFYKRQIVYLEKLLNVQLGGLHKRRKKELNLIF